MKFRPKSVLGALLALCSQAAALERWQTVPSPPPLPQAQRSGFAAVNGIKMFFATYGRGEPILLVPIGMAAADIWARQIGTLSQHHTVVLADTRGQGRSSVTGQVYSYALLASNYLALLDVLKIKKVALVGASDGAIIGLEIAIHHPERLTKLFSQGANASPDGAYQNAADPTASKAASALWQLEFRTLSGTASQYDVVHKALSHMWDTEPHYTAKQLAGIALPTAIVMSDHDEWIKPDHARYLARTIPGAKLIVLRNVSHYAALQDPDAYAKAVLEFVDGH